VHLHHVQSDREAEPGPRNAHDQRLLASVEALEDAGLLLERNPDAGVGDLDLDHGARGPGAQPYLAPGGGVAVGVVHQVRQDLAHTLRVAPEPRQLAGRL